VTATVTSVYVRDAADADGPGIAAVVGAVFAEYHGCVLDIEGEMPDLLRPAESYARAGGSAWVAADADGTVHATCGVAPAAASLTLGPGWELHRLYVAKPARRQGLGHRFCALAEAVARERGGRFLEAWSDCRFVDAHRLYERVGFVRQPEIRVLNDRSHSVEYRFLKRF
jgi:putative acetyltransferase